jgi:ubiquinone/menaquinone biosynthesis C-methylase UbiE
MSTDIRSSRWSQIAAWFFASLFVLGFFVSPIGIWTAPILGVWFIGTQRPLRGLCWVMILGSTLSLLFGWRGFLLPGPLPVLQHLGWVLFAVLLSALPLSFHRLTSPRLPGLLATLPFPLACMAIPALIDALHVGPSHTIGIFPFLHCWFAAVIVWMWNAEFKSSRIRVGTSIFAPLFILAGGYALYAQRIGAALPSPTVFGAVSISAALALSIWALFHPIKHPAWAGRPLTVALLRSPFTGNPLQIVNEAGREALVSSSGERFPVRNGIPTFLRAEDLTGDNGKYNHLYETIGGFYDDTQRVACALKAMDRDSYFLGPLSRLEAKPGDAVLETSVGTGLNFKYLPRGVKLYGLDLSAEMLANCQLNLRRWDLKAELFLGNAESLPFADNSFDVVFHAGGINFFSDRAKAIREMIRVAKPGTLLLITDETEEYAKQVYEKMPIASGYYKSREQEVTTPIDLIPAEMEEIKQEMIKNGQFYVLTFRKPLAVPPAVGQTPSATCGGAEAFGTPAPEKSAGIVEAENQTQSTAA